MSEQGLRLNVRVSPCGRMCCVCDCVRACVCVLSPSVRPWLGRRREGDFKTGRGKEQRQLGMSEPLSCEERGGFCAVRTLSERCQNTVRTLSERCQNGQVSVRTGAGAPQTRLKVAREVARMDRRCSNSSSTASTTYEKWDGGPCSASLQRKVPRTFGEGAARRE